MMKLVVLFAALFMAVGTVQAQDLAKGQKLYKKKCVSCHGKTGAGKRSQKAPRLSGQFDWYIVSQLRNFQKKIRKNPKMLPFIRKLSEQDFKDLGAYIQTLK